MNLPKLKQKLKNNDLTNLYIFTGEEIGIMNKYVESIAKKSSKQVSHLDDFKQLYEKLSHKSLTKLNNTFILRNDKIILQSEKLWNMLSELIKNNIVILIFDKLDKRGKFYKRFDNLIVEFEKLSTAQLTVYVQKELGLKQNQAEELITYCDNNYNRLMLEIDKIKCLAAVEKCKNEEAFLIAMEEDLIYKTPKSLIYDFVDAVLKRDTNLSFKLYVDLKNLKKNDLAILSLLYNNFRNVLIISGHRDEKVTQESTGLTGWQIQNIKDKCGYYKIEELIEILKIIQNVESGIKSGKIETEISIEYCILSILSI